MGRPRKRKEATPLDTHLQSVLLAAGLERWTHSEFGRAKNVLASILQQAHPQLVRSKTRWRLRATNLRKKHEPDLVWFDEDEGDPLV